MTPPAPDPYVNQRATFRKYGILILAIGILLDAVALFDFFLAFVSMSGGEQRMPVLFFLGFLGGPMIVIGAIMTALGYSKEIIRFFTQTFSSAVEPPPSPAPPLHSASPAPAADSARADAEREPEIVCPACKWSNQASAVFCQSCGNRLVEPA